MRGGRGGGELSSAGGFEFCMSLRIVSFPKLNCRQGAASPFNLRPILQGIVHMARVALWPEHTP